MKRRIITFMTGVILLGTAIMITCFIIGGQFIGEDHEEKQRILSFEPPNEEKRIDSPYQKLITWQDMQEEERNIAVLGVDKDGYRTDVIFVVEMNKVEDEWHTQVISIPRDTYIKWDAQEKDLAVNKGIYVEESKINEMLAYGGVENLQLLTIKEIEELLDIKIDQYVMVTIDSFRETVDLIGGIYVDVPENIPEIQAGKQLLNGEEAEKLIRYRGYNNADLGRIETRNIFLKGAMETLKDPKVYLKLPNVVEVIFNSVDTNVKLTDFPFFYDYIKQTDIQDIEFSTIPGYAEYMDGRSYFFSETK